MVSKEQCKEGHMGIMASMGGGKGNRGIPENNYGSVGQKI